jgi:hypothetical protein
MKRPTHRLLLLALATGAIISCDTRLPTAARRTVASGTPPTVVIDTPIVNTLVNLGDSIFVLVNVTGGSSLKSLVLQADKLTGVKDLGTFAETPRFNPITVTFPPGTIDTTIRRYLQVINPADLTLDSIVVLAIATDSLGLVDTAAVRATIVSGPHVTIDSPAANDSIPPGVGVSISAHATDALGVARISIHVTGDPTWITPLDDTITAVYDGSSRDVVFTGVVQIPLNALARSRVVVNASATNTARQPGAAAPISLFIRSAASIAAPRVTQVVPVLSERTDTVVITASGAGITAVGLIIHDEAGSVVRNDTTVLPLPVTSNVRIGVPMQLTLAQQGQHMSVTAFAIDLSGRIGFAVRATTTGSETVLANALADSTEIAYGQTYTMPIQGIVGDVTVDTPRGNIFMSNKSHNRLEVFSNGTRTFSANGLTVGSEPWGMTMTAKSPDSLLVANSGGTTISRVCIAAICGGIQEDLANRMRTRNIFVFQVTETPTTITVSDPISYSDRPQYIAQSATGRVFFSTVPTSTAALGTIRWLDPNLSLYPAPDPHLIWQYGSIEAGSGVDWAVFNVDSIVIQPSVPGIALPDGLFIWDHPYGQVTGPDMCASLFAPPPAPDYRSICVQATKFGLPVASGGILDATVESLFETMKAQGSDIEWPLRLDLTTLGLTDTTFVASSFDKNWVAFGEGNSSGTAGRIMMTNDPSPTVGINPLFFSPHVTVADLTDNASEKVFGLALDKSGQTVASHGTKSFFAAVDNPFHLRLEGLYDSFADGAGIALHPEADGQNTSPDTKRLAFVASSSGKVEIVDIAHFNNRGTLRLKYPVYGPLRASEPMLGDNTDAKTGLPKVCPGDLTCVVLKLFAITARGLIVIDLTALDIKQAPP